MSHFDMFIPITKVDATQRLVYWPCGQRDCAILAMSGSPNPPPTRRWH